MGNKCCKTKITDSVKAQSEARTVRGRLFRTLGCGKFVASVAVDDGINKRIEEMVEPKDVKATSKLFLRLSISDLIRKDKDAFFSTSSLIDMLNNDTGYNGPDIQEKEFDDYKGGIAIMVEPSEGEGNRNKEDVDVDLNTATVVDDGHVYKSPSNDSEIIERIDKEDAKELVCTETGEDKSGDILDEDEKENGESYTEDTHHSVEKPETGDVVKGCVNDVYCQTKLTRLDIKTNDDINKDDVKLETTQNKEMATKSLPKDFSVFTNESVFQNRPLSPEFFSAPHCNLYTDFAEGEVIEEVGEEIVGENGDDDQDLTDKHCLWINSTNKMPVLGKGEVSLQFKDIQAAISRLAFLNEGLDPLVESDDIDNKTVGENTKVTLEGEYQVQKEFHEGMGQSSQKSEKDLDEGFDTLPRIIVSNNESEEDYETKTSNNMDIQKLSVHSLKIENNDVCQTKQFHTSTRRMSDSLPSPNVDHLVKDVKLSASEPTVEVEKANEQEDDTKSLPILSETVDKSTALTPIKSNISIAAALSLETLKSHNSRTDCLLSVYVRPANSNEEPRKIDIRASSRQVKDGTAAKHVRLLEDIHLPPKLHGPIPAKSRRSKDHLYKTPSVVEYEEDRQVKWTQSKGPKHLTQPTKVPTFHETTTKAKNSRERLGLERLQKYKIRIQCKAIERIKIDADEFPGILPPSIRDRFRQKVDKKKHMN